MHHGGRAHPPAQRRPNPVATTKLKLDVEVLEDGELHDGTGTLVVVAVKGVSVQGSGVRVCSSRRRRGGGGAGGGGEGGGKLLLGKRDVCLSQVWGPKSGKRRPSPCRCGR